MPRTFNLLVVLHFLSTEGANPAVVAEAQEQQAIIAIGEIRVLKWQPSKRKRVFL